ncbi:hypothetical protein F4808DRAFT_452731 [Astrocystis sublimbata]|nr:hypothetical protein F4808DRAFT_452731 [Astrocystis sublimbata]
MLYDVGNISISVLLAIILFKYLISIFIGSFIPGVLAGGCLSALRDPDADPAIPNSDKWDECRNPVPPGGWACTKKNLAFPNVDCIIADLKACGNIGTGPTVFYSMGARTFQARQGLRDQLDPKGVMFNDALGFQWWENLNKKRRDFNLVGQPERQGYLRNLFAIAMAQVSSGEVFLATASRISKADPPGEPGIFQNPKELPNIWREFELPTLQRNPAITAITHVDIENNYQKTTDWRRGDSNIFPLPNIDTNNPPSLVRRQNDTSGDSCPFPPFPSESPTPTISTKSSGITPAPSLSCELHHQDPDQGITEAFCLCNESITLTPLPATSEYSESCAYTTVPVSTAFATITTQTEIWTTSCQACRIVGGIEDPDACSMVAGCTPTATPTPTIAAWVGNLSTINIGNAEDGNGGKNLAIEMFTKLKMMCDGESGCRSDHAEMDNVETVISSDEEPLKPAMYLQDAQFSSQDVLEKMLAVGIASWISALNNEDLMLCKDVEYEADADETGSGCGQGPIQSNRLRRTERGGLKEERKISDRCFDLCDPPLLCHYQARICNSPNEITVVMAGDGDPYANRLNIGVVLDEVEDGFPCKEVAEAITAGLVLLAPELIGEEAFEEMELEALCGVLDDPASITDAFK